MLVVLQNKEIRDRWDLFKDVLRSSVPITKDMLPNWLIECLYLALTGRIQCWVAFDPQDKKDEFYTAFITKKVVDEITGQNALLVYAIKVFKRVRKEVRVEDMKTFGRIASSYGAKRITAFCPFKTVENSLRKAFPHVNITPFISVPIEDE